MLFCELFARQYVDDLRTVKHQPPKSISIDRLWHQTSR
jgi:hypothetical protein